MARSPALISAALALAAGALLGLGTPPAQAGALWLKSCAYFGDPGTASDVDGPVWQPQGPNGFALVNRCQLGGSFQVDASGHVPDGASAEWHTITPPSIGITGALTPRNQVLILPAPKFDGFAAAYFWAGGSQPVTDQGSCCGGMDYGLGINRNDLNNSHYFGFEVACIQKGGCGLVNKQELLDVKGIELMAQDNTPPGMVALGAGNLWYQASHWVRGEWPINFQASDASGVCGMRALVDGQSIPGPTANPNQSSWTQCPSPQTMSQSIDTSRYPNGPLSLILSAADAASPANVSSPGETLSVDNSPVNLSLSGVANAPSTAGTQYVTATASAGPSGLDGISCSVDGSPAQWYPGSSARIPVSGVGKHFMQCVAANNAIGADGGHGSSPVESFSIKIGVPTVTEIAFSKLVAGLRCHRVRERVRIRARWVTVRRQHRRVRVHRRARTKVVNVLQCRARTVRPVGSAIHTRRVGHGHPTTVSGWLGTYDGVALGGQKVEILAAPDNGQHAFRPVATALTTANGSWSARLPAGPSRLVEAFYGGGADVEPSLSGQVHEIVPAEVHLLRVVPRRVAWGGMIRIVGQLKGGYLPPGGALVRLRIGIGSTFTTYGVREHVGGNGRFTTTYTFGPGDPAVHRSYWFQIASLPMGDYPYAPASSRRLSVLVGG